MITGEQLRAARAMLRMDQGQLASEADISAETLKRFEAAEGEIKGRLDNILNLERVLLARGIEFISSGDDDPIGGRGVRFAEDRTKRYRHLIANKVKDLAFAVISQANKNDPDLFSKGPDHLSDILVRDLPVLIRHTMASTMKFKNGIGDKDLFSTDDERS